MAGLETENRGVGSSTLPWATMLCFFALSPSLAMELELRL